MLPSKLAFVDLETTGGRAHFDRIIEIGIVKVEENKITDTYSTLINPLTYLPTEIEKITGITSADLVDAPTFADVKRDVLELLDDCVFVAHNVRFDYGFLKSEFAREEISFTSKHFCTVRLSRILYPQFRHHNLDSIIERFNFSCVNRHRALDDAKILVDFYSKIQAEFPAEQVGDAISVAMKKPTLPLHLQNTALADLPESPGVYMFFGENNTPLYVGKSINVRDRVLSHFSSDIRSGVEMKISQQIQDIQTITTAGELGALLLESHLIKKMLPLYNKKLRLKRELVAVKGRKNIDGYEEVYLEPIQKIAPSDLSNPEESYNGTILGFFQSKKKAKSFLSNLAKEFQLCEKLLGLEKTSTSCFAYRLDRCTGACVGKESAIRYNMRFVSAIANFKIKPWPFSGPIAIEEQNLITKTYEYFLLDKWCYLGKFSCSMDGQTEKSLENEQEFDMDVYKILLRYMRSPSNLKKIKQLRDMDVTTFSPTRMPIEQPSID